MELLNIDVGLKSYQLVEGGAPLTFNPGDPNVYARYVDALKEIQEVGDEMSRKANAVEAKDDSEEEKIKAGAESLRVMHETDTKMKEILNGVFGAGNDFDKILRGINLAAVTEAGNRVIDNVINALTPIMQNGAKACVETEVKEAKLNREQRRALGL